MKSWRGPQAGADPSRGRRVRVELRGGNDGLNTLVPYRDPEYDRLRPTLARDRVLALDDDLGGAPALQPLLPAWDAGERAWILGVGYPNPNRSHFRSREIWDTAAPGAPIREPDWIARAFGIPGQGNFTANSPARTIWTGAISAIGWISGACTARSRGSGGVRVTPGPPAWGRRSRVWGFCELGSRTGHHRVMLPPKERGG